MSFSENPVSQSTSSLPLQSPRDLPAEKPPAVLPRPKIRVLLVDDDDNYSALVRDVLGFAENYTVDRASDFQGMWDLLEQVRFDALLLDYRFPGGTGLDALAQVAERKLDVPVIIVTGRGDERIAAQAIQQGAADYLVKSPETVFELPVLITKAIRNYSYLVESRKFLEKIRYQALLLDNVRDAVVVWDSAGRISYWNPAAESLYGWAAADRLGLPAEEAYFQAFDPPIDPLAPGSDPSAEAERRILTGRGAEIWISSRITTLRDEVNGGTFLGYMDVTRDITQRKRTEQQILAAQNRLVESARLSALGELAAGVAHQINNPLTAIIAESQILMRSGPPEPAVRESLEQIERAGWKAQQAVQDLLEFSRATPDSYQSLSINETIQKAIRLVGAPMQTAGIGLEVDLAEDIPSVRGFAGALEDLWVNLLLLARDAGADGTPHCIRVRSYRYRGDSVAVEVTDNGATIPAADLPGLFEPHFEGPVAGRGNGMEYSICRDIAQRHKGTIRAISKPDFGTIIRVTFPTEEKHGAGQHSGD